MNWNVVKMGVKATYTNEIEYMKRKLDETDWTGFFKTIEDNENNLDEIIRIILAFEHIDYITLFFTYNTINPNIDTIRRDFIDDICRNLVSKLTEYTKMNIDYYILPDSDFYKDDRRSIWSSNK